MALIGKIRQRSALLVVVIGVALAAFILGDFAKRTNRHQMNIGTINGENISIQEFNKKFDENVKATQQQQNNEHLSQDEMYRLRESTWSQMVQNMIMQSEYDKLGLTVTSDELFDEIQGPNPHPAVISNFTNPETGAFDRKLVLDYLQNLDKMRPEAKNQWLLFERYIKDDRLRTKYQNLISKSYHMPKAFAELVNHEKNDKLHLTLVGVRYASIADSLVNVTDADYQAFYNENKKSFEKEATRDIEYINFKIEASAEDNQNAFKTVESLKDEFARTANNESFVNANSESRYDSSWLSRNNVSVALESFIFDEQPGYIYGPYYEDGFYKLVKLVRKDERADSLKANHILIAYKGALRSDQSRTEDQAKTLADSIYNVVKKQPSKFGELASLFSDDNSAKNNGGDLGWFTDGQMVPEFNNFVLRNKVGTYGLVQTDFGYHVIEVTGKTAPQPKIQLATIVYQVTPSSTTYQNTFAKASKFASENKTAEQFNKAVEAESLNKRVVPSLREMGNNIPGIDNPRQIIRWAFDEKTKVGDVSTIFELDNNFVIAVLTKKSDKGIPSLNDIKENIKPQVINRKKGEYVVEKMNQAGQDLEHIAHEFNSHVETTDLAFDSRMLLNYGQESKVIGKIFAMPENSFSTIAGSTAAFAVKTGTIDVTSAEPQVEQLANESRSTFESSVRNNVYFRAIEKISDIKDNRKSFY